MGIGRACYWGTLAAYAVLIAWQALTLPDVVPLHSDLAGHVDRWGSKSEHLALAVGLALLMLLFGPGTSALVRFTPQSLTNIPNPDYWKRDANWPEAQRRLAASLWPFGALFNAFLFVVMAWTGEQARGASGPPWLFLALVVGFLAATGWWIAWLYRQFRVPDAPGRR